MAAGLGDPSEADRWHIPRVIVADLAALDAAGMRQLPDGQETPMPRSASQTQIRSGRSR